MDKTKGTEHLMTFEEIEKRKQESRRRKAEARPAKLKEKRRDTLWLIKGLKASRKAVINLTLDSKPWKYSWDNPQRAIDSHKTYIKGCISRILSNLYFMDRIYLHKILSRYFKRTIG